jgi:poly-gamma-glutamate synthesis protein (capsule biosynthesis protein)
MLKIGKRVAAALAAAVMLAAVLLAADPGAIRYFRHEVVISFAGDILLDRGVADALEQNGMAYPYGGIARLFRRDDITVANLECPLTSTGGGAMKAKRFVFKADPKNAGVLKSAGFDALMLANNHTMDFLSAGLSDTMTALENTGLLYAGAGRSREEIGPCFINKNGISIGILSYSSLPPECFMYDGGSATIAYARAGYLDGMQKEIRNAAARCDFLIVYFHWGTEYRHDASDLQIEIAHAAVDFGAAAVVGTHPHVLQGRESYKGVPIYYSVGNFVFDKQIPEGTDEAVVVQMTVGKNGIIAVHELPVVIERCRPHLAEGEKAAGNNGRLGRYSRDRFESLSRRPLRPILWGLLHAGAADSPFSIAQCFFYDGGIKARGNDQSQSVRSRLRPDDPIKAEQAVHQKQQGDIDYALAAGCQHKRLPALSHGLKRCVRQKIHLHNGHGKTGDP